MIWRSLYVTWLRSAVEMNTISIPGKGYHKVVSNIYNLTTLSGFFVFFDSLECFVLKPCYQLFTVLIALCFIYRGIIGGRNSSNRFVLCSSIYCKLIYILSKLSWGTVMIVPTGAFSLLKGSSSLIDSKQILISLDYLTFAT